MMTTMVEENQATLCPFILPSQPYNVYEIFPVTGLVKASVGEAFSNNFELQ